MGQFNGFVWIVILSIYFFVFVTITTLLDTTTQSDYIDLSNYYKQTSFCSEPRTFNLLNGNDVELVSTDDLCMRTKGQYDNNTCNGLAGCTWTASGWNWLTTTDTYYCDGNLNFSAYSNFTSKYDFIKDTPTGFCGLRDVLYNKTLCNNLGCTWVNAMNTTQIEQSYNTGGILSTIGRLFTFRYDFGFETYTNSIFIFFMFWLPLLMLIGAIYFILPFLH